ncbi:MAG: sensor histidine kinase, partial [Candidatus Binatia bacterium]
SGDGRVDARFEEARRAEALGRLRRGSFFLLPPLTLALAVNIRVFGDGMPIRALALVGMLGLAALTHVAVGERAAGRRAIPMAIAFVLALGMLLLGMFVEAPEGRDLHVGAVSALMMGAAIVIPWGFWPQLTVGLVLACAYALLPGWTAIADGQAVELMFPLVDCVALSAVGAYVLDRQRRIAFAEREQACAMTAQRELLLDANRELNASLDVGETVATITRVARALVGGDTVGLVLVDERRQVLRTVSLVGDLIEVDREVLNLEVPLMALQPLIDELRTLGVARTPDGPLAPMGAFLREQFGVTASIYVAVARGDHLLGYLVFTHRDTPGDFTAEQLRLAQGFAPECAIALTNARLVADLQRANRVKTEFVSTMSHELRTPLSVMLGYVDVLEDAVAGDEGKVVVDRIRAAGRELLDLVQTTLDLNRLESGQDPPQCEPVSMHELWDELGGQYQAIPRPAGVALRWEAHGQPIAFTDRRKLKIVVKNLVGNALKFTAAGEIVASVRGAGDHCLVVVRDTGIGIPADQLPHIFDLFRQVDNSDQRSYGGVGLGLYIVRKLAEQMGASLEVVSTPGKGTTFTLRLPAADAMGAAAAA